MWILRAAVMVGAAGGLYAGLVLSAAAQDVNDKPLRENWFPGECAPDEVGAPNRTTPELVLEALKLVKQGKVAALGKLYVADMPLIPWRSYRMIIPGAPTGGPFGSNKLVFHDEFISKGDFFYNGRDREKDDKRGPGNTVIGMDSLG